MTRNCILEIFKGMDSGSLFGWNPFWRDDVMEKILSQSSLSRNIVGMKLFRSKWSPRRNFLPQVFVLPPLFSFANISLEKRRALLFWALLSSDSWFGIIWQKECSDMKNFESASSHSLCQVLFVYFRQFFSRRKHFLGIFYFAQIISEKIKLSVFF